MLALLAVAELLGMSLWFTGSAVAPILQERWQLTGEQVGWLTTMVQIGFVAGTWFRARRGLAVGTVVGALTIGKAGPYLVHAFPGAGVVPVVLTASASAVLAAIIVLIGYRDGPYPFAPRPFSWGLVSSVVRNREWRLASGGYFGHMLELYPA